MPPQLDSHVAPEKCRWLKFKDHPAVRPSNWTKAVCVRMPGHSRHVTPARDCVGCQHWESSESD
jgi:hypothetical protein